MKKDELVIYYDEAVRLIPIPRYALSMYDSDKDPILQIIADSLEVSEVNGRKYLKCFRRGVLCNLIYLNDIECIKYDSDAVKYYSDLSIDTLESILEKNSEKENKEND